MRIALRWWTKASNSMKLSFIDRKLAHQQRFHNRPLARCSQLKLLSMTFFLPFCQFLAPKFITRNVNECAVLPKPKATCSTRELHYFVVYAIFRVCKNRKSSRNQSINQLANRATMYFVSTHKHFSFAVLSLCASISVSWFHSGCYSD